MSLINLLTVGATFKGVKDRSGSYKLASIAPLPKFGAPNAATPAPAAPKEAISEAVEAAPGSLPETPSASVPGPRYTANLIHFQEVMDKQSQAGRSPKIQGVGSEGTIDLPADCLLRMNPSPAQEPPAAAKKPEQTPLPSTTPAAADAPFKGVKRLVNQFFFGRAPRPARAANVQTELALDKVTVVRNDLSEEGRTAGASGRKDTATTCLDAAEAVGAWFNLSARFAKRTPAIGKPADREAATEPELAARM